VPRRQSDDFAPLTSKFIFCQRAMRAKSMPRSQQRRSCGPERCWSLAIRFSTASATVRRFFNVRLLAGVILAGVILPVRIKKYGD
jgi:hypothetical protein